MKTKRIAVLIITPLIIALTVLTFFLIYNSQYWMETGNNLNGALTELDSVVIVWLEVDIFISLIYFTSKKEKRKDIKTTANKMALYLALLSFAVHIFSMILNIAHIPANNKMSIIVYSIFMLLAIVAFFAVIVARTVHFISAVYYIIKGIKAKRDLPEASN